MHPGSVLRLLGFICLFMAAIMLLPAIVCAYYGERDGVEAFALTILAMVVFSVCSILYAARSKELRISRRDSFLAVTLVPTISQGPWTPSASASSRACRASVRQGPRS